MNIFRKPFKYSFFYATFILLGINALFFVAGMIFPNLKNIYLGLNYFTFFKYRFYWTPVTYMFVHGGWLHFILNMLVLAGFGIQLERAVGSVEFLFYYFLCGILDGIISIVIYRIFGWNVYLIGASGAIYALLLAFSVVFPRSIISIWGIIPVPAPLLVLIYVVIDIVSGLFMRNNVANLTHLCGFAVGWLYLLIRMGIHPVRVWKNAWRR